MRKILIAIAIILGCISISFLTTVLMWWLYCEYVLPLFGIVYIFTWKTAFGIWIMIIILKNIFRTTK